MELQKQPSTATATHSSNVKTTSGEVTAPATAWRTGLQWVHECESSTHLPLWEAQPSNTESSGSPRALHPHQQCHDARTHPGVTHAPRTPFPRDAPDPARTHLVELPHANPCGALAGLAISIVRPQPQHAAEKGEKFRPCSQIET